MKEIELFEKNEEQDLKNEFAKRKSIQKNRKLADKLYKQVKKEVDAGSGGSLKTERLIRAQQKYEDIIKIQELDLPDLDKQYKILIKKLRDKFPKELQKIKNKQEKEIVKRLDRLIVLMEKGS